MGFLTDLIIIDAQGLGDLRHKHKKSTLKQQIAEALIHTSIAALKKETQ